MVAMGRLLAGISVIASVCCGTLVLAPRSFSQISAATISDETELNADALPQWLRVLELTPTQTQQVIEIDAVLHQQMTVILTTGQYETLKLFMRNDEAEQASIYEANLDLSPYQQAALDAVFENAIMNIVNILSQEQQQQFFYNLENQTSIEPSLGI